MIHADDAGREQLRAKVAGVLDYGYEARWLRRSEALRLEPDLNPAELPADEIAYFPGEGWIEPTRLIAHLQPQAFGIFLGPFFGVFPEFARSLLGLTGRFFGQDLFENLNGAGNAHQGPVKFVEGVL